jgi:hypothetical protein
MTITPRAARHSAAMTTSTTAFTSAFDRLAAGVMVIASLLVLASSVAIFVLDSPVAGGAMGMVGAALLGAVATGITRPLQARMPRRAAALTVVFAYGFVVGGVAFNLETILVSHGMMSFDSTDAFPVLGMSGVLGPLSLVGIGAALLVSRVGRADGIAGVALTLCGALFPVSRVFDIASVALSVDTMLVVGMAALAWGLVRPRTAAPVPASATRQPVAA